MGGIRGTVSLNVAGCTPRNQYRFLTGPISLPNAAGIVSSGRPYTVLVYCIRLVLTVIRTRCAPVTRGRTVAPVSIRR